MGWSKEDDAKLASLFRKGKKNKGASSKDISKDHIREIAKKHWKERSEGKQLDSFCRLYRKKARIWNLNKTLTGESRGKLACSNEL